MIKFLQAEMTSEQEYFNELSAQLAMVEHPDSQDGQALSARMIESQTRLTDLVSRNMKCFMLVSSKLYCVPVLVSCMMQLPQNLLVTNTTSVIVGFFLN